MTETNSQPFAAETAQTPEATPYDDTGFITYVDGPGLTPFMDMGGKPGMHNVRFMFGQLNDHQAATLDRALNSHVDPHESDKLVLPMPQELAEKLPEGWGWTDWLAQADDEDLIDFMNWHAEAAAYEEQSDEFQEAVRDEKELYELALRRGIRQGWLVDNDTRMQKLARLQVYVGDYTDTLIHDYLGYHSSGEDFVVISQGNAPAEVRDSAMHEFNHAVLGRFGSRWLNEALTEHIALVFKNGGSVDQIEPELSTRIGAYIDERLLLSIICNYGKEQVPARLFTRAYSTPVGEQKGEAIQEVRDALASAWGRPNLLTELSAEIVEVEKELSDSGQYDRPSVLQATAVRIVTARLLGNDRGNDTVKEIEIPKQLIGVSRS